MTDHKNKDPLYQRIERLLVEGRTDECSPSPEVIEKIIGEFGVYQQELAFQNDELKRIQEELEKSQRFFKVIFDEAPMGYLLLTVDGKVTKANRRIRDWLGVEERELVARPFSVYVASEDQDAYYFHIKKILEEKREDRVYLHLSGGRKPIYVEMITHYHDDGSGKPFLKVAVLEQE